MRTLTTVLFILAAAVMAAPAQTSTTWEGYLADQMCGTNWKGAKGEERAKKHTRSCGLDESCAASGYGIYSNGVFLKFTEASSPQAKAYLEKSKARSNIRVRVVGTLDGEKIAVTRIETAGAKSGTL